MPWVIWFLVIMLTGCSSFSGYRDGAVPRLKDGPDVTDYRNADASDAILRDYVTEVNLYAFYVFNYTKALNDYATKHGWHPLPMPPICEQYMMPGLMDIPDFVFRRGIKSDDEVDMALASYIRALRARMNENALRVNNAFAKHREACIY